MEYKSIDQLDVWNTISNKKAENLAIVFESCDMAKRVKDRQINAGGGLIFSYAAMDIDDETIATLAKAATELKVIDQYKATATGEIMNQGEMRMVLHHIARGTPFRPVIKDGFDYRAFYESERARFSDFAVKVRSGLIKGCTGKAFTKLVQIGIGGSDLGPRALYLALKEWARANKCLKIEADFISNVDPDDANAVLNGLNPETSLFVLVSKSGTTQETLANESLVRAWLRARGISDTSKHFIAVTSQTSPLAKNSNYLASFYIDDFIGGRYSSSSAVGGVALSIAFGPDAFFDMLNGAAEADVLAMNNDIYKNPALMAAMLGLFERNVLLRPSVAILPYTQALSRFPAHLQQLDMESNGKVIKRDGTLAKIQSGPVIFGEPGTNGQHSFYQLLHQGSDIIPIDFIGFKNNQTDFDPPFEGSTARTKLNANLVAQIVAFAGGKSDKNLNKNFYGQRPSSLIVGDMLNPKALGALLAHYENKVMFQGFAWNINSFDQEGVQLGKKLTSAVLSMQGATESKPSALSEYAKLLGVI